MKNAYTNEPSRSAALAGALNRPGIEILRYGLVIVLLWVGGMKFTSYEAAGIAPLEMHSPLMNWLYVLMGQRNISDLLGVVEIALGVGIALRYIYPLVSGIASLLSVGMFLTTLSFLFTTPGWEPTLGFPAISAYAGPVPVEGCRTARRSDLHRQRGIRRRPQIRNFCRTRRKRYGRREVAFWPFGQRTIRSAVHGTA